MPVPSRILLDPPGQEDVVEPGVTFFNGSSSSPEDHLALQSSPWEEVRKSLQDLYEAQRSSLKSFEELLRRADLTRLDDMKGLALNGEGSELSAHLITGRFYKPMQEDSNPPGSPNAPNTPKTPNSPNSAFNNTKKNWKHKAFLRSSQNFSKAVLTDATSLSLRAPCPKCGEEEHVKQEEVAAKVQEMDRVQSGFRALMPSRTMGGMSTTLFGKGSIWHKVFFHDDTAADFHPHWEHHSWWVRLRYWCFCIASKKMFDYVMGLVILANAVSVGFEVQSSVDGDEDIGWMYWLDFAFVMIYIVEFSVRVLAWGCRKCFSDSWCLFDFCLVTIGVLSLIAQPLGLKVKELESLLVVRSLRLLRLIRALRLLKQFRTVWRLVNGLLTSANAMFSTLVLVVLTLYIAACLGVEIITKDTALSQHTETGSIVSQHFGTLPSTLLTLSAFVTLDSVASIYSPLIVHKPELALYFFFIILFVSVALMNLVTAVLVEGALENASADKELEKMDLQEKLRGQMPRLLQIFADIDKDGSGTLTMEEMSMVPVDVIPEELRSKSRVSSMQEVFEMLDVDGGGELTKEEFVDGLLNLFLQDVPVTSLQTLRLLRSVDARVWRLGEEMFNLRASLEGRRPKAIQ